MVSHLLGRRNGSVFASELFGCPVGERRVPAQAMDVRLKRWSFTVLPLKQAIERCPPKIAHWLGREYLAHANRAIMERARSTLVTRLVFCLFTATLVLCVACIVLLHGGSATAQTTLSRELILQQVDGGPSYYGKFTNGLPTEPSYFPIGLWLEAIPAGQADIDRDKDAGINLYVGIADPENANLALLRSNAMYAIIQENERTRFSGIGSETVGWVVGDEVDMAHGPSRGYEHLINTLTKLPNDLRLRYSNYGKGVMFWQTDQEAQRFVNEFQQVVSNDMYWFTDPHACRGRSRVQSVLNKLFNRPAALPDRVCRLAANYGSTVERMRLLDGMDGRRMPIWNFVEVGWPFTETAAQGGRMIVPGEVRAAVWHSLIAGARGIVYFNHSFGGPCPSHHALREPCYTNVRATVKSVNEQIKALASVLNSPTVSSHFLVSASVKAMMKWDGNNFYVFAGSARNEASTSSFSLSCIGSAAAVVIGEDRTIPVIGGTWEDSFPNGNAIHIYRIEGGSKCALPNNIDVGTVPF